MRLLAGGAQWAMAELHCWTVGGSLACDPMPQPSIQISKSRLSCIQLALITLGLQPSVCPSVETRRRNVSQVCFQFCLYSEEFGTNHYGHVKGMSDLSTFQFCNWFDNIWGPFVNCVPLLRPIADGWYIQSDTGQFLIAKNIHPELSIWSPDSGRCHRGFWFPWILSTFVDDYQPRAVI